MATLFQESVGFLEDGQFREANVAIGKIDTFHLAGSAAPLSEPEVCVS